MDKLNNYYNKLDDLAKKTVEPEEEDADEWDFESRMERAERMMDQDEEPDRMGE